MDSLAISERQELQRHEQIIKQGLNTFVEVGHALAAIRDSRLYREDYGTFEDYCQDKWGMKQSNVYRYMEAAKVVKLLESSPIGELLPATESQARPLTRLEPAEQVRVWEQVVATAPEGKITAAHVQAVVDDVKRPVSYHVSDDSYEWYTPAEYIEAARGVMGSIDFDPASSDEANKTVMAEYYCTKETDGLSQKWGGNVWLNPPYNMPLIEQFIDKVVSEYETGGILSAIVLTNNATDTKWFHKLVNYPICFTRGRINFYAAGGTQGLATRQGQAIFYLGNNPDLFAKVFSSFGVVLERYDNRKS